MDDPDDGETIFPPIPWNVCMKIRACAAWNFILNGWKWWNQYQYYRFELNGRFYHSIQSNRVNERWGIKFEDIPGCIGDKVTNVAIYRTQQTTFDKIVSPMRYKVHARQKFCIVSPRMTRVQYSCDLQRSERFSQLVLYGKRRVHLVQEN